MLLHQASIFFIRKLKITLLLFIKSEILVFPATLMTLRKGLVFFKRPSGKSQQSFSGNYGEAFFTHTSFEVTPIRIPLY